MRKVVGIFTVCFMIISMFSGCALMEKLGLQGKNDELTPVSSIVMNEDDAKKLSDKVPIHLYFATEDGAKLKLEVRYIPMSEAKKSANNLAATIVKELIKGPGPNSGLKATIPAGSNLRSPVTINAGVATVDFTKDFVDKHPGGKEAEQLTIYSVVNSLTELKEIQKVKFTVNGKAQKDYKGNFQFDVPFPRSASIISKDTAPTAASASTNDTKKQETDKSKQEPAKDNKKEPAKAPAAKSTSGQGLEETQDDAQETFDEEILE